jgi:hypothetical protein
MFLIGTKVAKSDLDSIRHRQRVRELSTLY